MAFGKNRKHSKPGQTTVRAFHFRLEATPEEAARLHGALDLGWQLRNRLTQALDDDRQAQRLVRQEGGKPEYLGALALKRQVASKEVGPELCALHSQVRQDLANRVSEGMQRFFGALREGRTGVRPPRFIERKHFRSITYPQYGTSAFIRQGRLHLSKLGEFRVTGWRRMRGKKKSITLKFKDGHFWAIVLCEVQAHDVVRPYSVVRALPEVGIDPGLATVLTYSLNTGYETPKPLKAARTKLTRRQRVVSRKFECRKKAHLEQARAQGIEVPPLKTAPVSNRLKAAIVKLAKAHTEVERVRDDVAKKVARRI
jgi:putative transposase